jgi:transcriptional regulator with XRE-family HTH domain
MKFCGEALRRARMAKGISQVKMATDLKINQSLLSKYERGEVVNVSYQKVQQMADYLNIDADDLYSARADKNQRLDVHVYFHFVSSAGENL